MASSVLHNSRQAPGLLCEDGEGDLANSDYRFSQCSFSVKEPSKGDLCKIKTTELAAKAQDGVWILLGLNLDRVSFLSFPCPCPSLHISIPDSK